MTRKTDDTCGGCQALENETLPRVTLLDGREVTTWCECWRLECHARHQVALEILAYTSKHTRNARLDQIEQIEGPLARERMEAEVRREWAARRARRMGDAAA